HLTDLMVRSADIIVTYKHYPHTDIYERAEDVWRLATAAYAGEIRPVAARAECHMISVWHTTRAPMDDFVTKMTAAQGQGGILAVSFCHGFALGDVPDLGARMLVYADGDLVAAQAVADQMARALWAMREQTRTRWLGVHEGLDTAQEHAGGAPVVIADVSDNPGMGAGGDNTELLAELIRRQLRGALVGLLFDPMAVELCLGLEEDATFMLRIGGKFSPRSGPPLDLTVRLLRVARDAHQTSVSGPTMPIGNVVLLQTQEGVLIAINDLRTQVFHPDAFEGVGVDVAACPVIVVKSTQHFHAGFAPLAAQVLYVRNSHAVSFEGPVPPYRHRDGDYWPCTERPSATLARSEVHGA
ncbi:MAG: M81 family peptidase, partial [Comamonadaceae bacterium]